MGVVETGLVYLSRAAYDAVILLLLWPDTVIMVLFYRWLDNTSTFFVCLWILGRGLCLTGRLDKLWKIILSSFSELGRLEYRHCQRYWYCHRCCHRCFYLFDESIFNITSTLHLQNSLSSFLCHFCALLGFDFALHPNHKIITSTVIIVLFATICRSSCIDDNFFIIVFTFWTWTWCRWVLVQMKIFH